MGAKTVIMWKLVVLGIGLLALLGVTAIILGSVALVRINRSGGALRGRRLAIAAIVIGALMLLGSLLLIPLSFTA